MAAAAEQLRQQPTFGPEQTAELDCLIPEKLKSFDPLASVDMLRYDIKNYGYVYPETKERVCDEELSYLVEGIDRASRTSFTLPSQVGELVYFNEGEWQPYNAMLMKGLEVARHEAQQDRRRQFLVDRAVQDLTKGYAMSSLQPGEQHIWYSSFDHDTARQYGDLFMQSCGFRPDKQLGFIYSAQCQEDGSVLLESQTVDQSDAEAFAAVDATIAFDPDTDLDALVRTYDGALAKKHGGSFFAGRRDVDIKENAWEAVLQQRDLIDYHLDKLETIARLPLPRDELEVATKEHLYGVWAAFKTRIDSAHPRYRVLDQQQLWSGGVQDNTSMIMYHQLQLKNEVQTAFKDFARQGRVLSGCGGSIKVFSGEDSIMDASAREVFGSIFGKEVTSEKYSFDKKMYCVDCQAPPKKGDSKKACGPCGLCRGCDKKAGGKG